MRNGKFRLGGKDGIHGRDTTGVKHRDFIVQDVHRVTKIGIHHVLDANGGRSPDRHRRTVRMGEFGRDGNFLDDVESLDGFHRHDHVACELAGRRAGNIGLVHGDVFVLFDRPQADARVEEGRFGGEGASNEKRHGIVGPVLRHIGSFLDEFPMLEYSIHGEVGAEVGGAGGAAGGGRIRPHVEHFDERTRLLVALAEEEKVKGILPAKDHQVALHVSRTNAIRSSVESPFSNGLSKRCRGER